MSNIIAAKDPNPSNNKHPHKSPTDGPTPKPTFELADCTKPVRVAIAGLKQATFEKQNIEGDTRGH